MAKISLGLLLDSYEFRTIVRERLAQAQQSGRFSDIEQCIITGAWFKSLTIEAAADMIVTYRKTTRVPRNGR